MSKLTTESIGSPSTREQFFEAVARARELITWLDALDPGTNDLDVLARVRVVDYDLSNAALDRADDFIWDRECRAAWSVKADLTEAWVRWGRRYRLHVTVIELADLESELRLLRLVATAHYLPGRRPV